MLGNSGDNETVILHPLMLLTSPASAKVVRGKLVANICRPRFDVVKAVTHFSELP